MNNKWGEEYDEKTHNVEIYDCFIYADSAKSLICFYEEWFMMRN